jgi:hypothetical protein
MNTIILVVCRASKSGISQACTQLARQCLVTRQGDPRAASN